jgi:hypothetical protein
VVRHDDRLLQPDVALEEGMLQVVVAVAVGIGLLVSLDHMHETLGERLLDRPRDRLAVPVEESSQGLVRAGLVQVLERLEPAQNDPYLVVGRQAVGHLPSLKVR